MASVEDDNPRATVFVPISDDHPDANNRKPLLTTADGDGRKKLTLIPLVFLIYFEVAGGPFGEEPVVQAAGPLFGILGFLVCSFIWSIPEALITAELSTTYPGNGGFVIWADAAFGPFWGSLLGCWKLSSSVINIATIPALAIDYLKRYYPILESGRPRNLVVFITTISLSVLNYMGLTIVGWVVVVLGVGSLLPFLIMSIVAIPQIQPKRWLSLGTNGIKGTNLNLYLNTLFWNLNFWDNVSTLAGEVANPKKTFPLGLLIAVIFTSLSYLLPLMAVAGAVSVKQSLWGSGFMADAAQIIVGKWVKIWIEIGVVLSSIGHFEAEMSSTTYQVVGMAKMGLLPRLFAMRSEWFNTPWVGIVVSCLISLGVSFMNFENLVASANFLYSLGMLLEFAAFLWLRWKHPNLMRPYRVPLNLPALVVMCFVPSVLLVLTMVVASKTVFMVSGVITIAAIMWSFFVKP